MVAGGWLTAVLVLIVAFRFVNPPVSALMLQQWLFGREIAQNGCLSRICLQISFALCC